MDYGKGLMKIICNWSRHTKDNDKYKLMGLKCGLILACVPKIPETYNMSVLIYLIQLNDIEYKLSQDLKLTNIVIGIMSHSSKYPCPYRECSKDVITGEYVKGNDHTVCNINEIL